MKHSTVWQKFTLPIFSLFFLVASYFVNISNEKPLMFISKQDQSVNFNASLFTYFNLGLKRLISSSLWVSTIVESDIDHYKKKDLNSWMFLRFDSISKIDPRFYENYTFGGIYLSIIKDDIPGASSIYKSGLAVYPNDYSLLRDAGYHFYLEANDPKESFLIYTRLKNNFKLSHSVINRLAKLSAQTGDLASAYEMLTELQTHYPPNDLIGLKILEHRYSIRAEQDLNCLNVKKLKNCNLKDLEGNNYILRNGLFEAIREWKAFNYKK